MANLLLVLFSIVPNPMLITETSEEVIRQNNLRIAKKIIDSDEPSANVYLIDQHSEVFHKPIKK